MYFINPFKDLRPTKENASSLAVASTDHLGEDGKKDHLKKNPWSYLNVFNAESEFKSKEQFDLMKKKSAPQNSSNPSNPSNSSQDNSGIMAFQKTEMTGYSDQYSYISEDGKAAPLSHSFSFMGDTPTNHHDSNKIVTESSSSNTRVSKSAGLDDAFERLKEAREREMSNMKRI